LLGEERLRRFAAATEIYNTPLLVRLLRRRSRDLSLQRDPPASGSEQKPKRKFVADKWAVKGILLNNYRCGWHISTNCCERVSCKSGQ